MKTRQGFVSNSSSSSFVVQNYSDAFSKKPKKCLSSAKVKKLMAHGFALDTASYPHQVGLRDMTQSHKLTPDEMLFATWTKAVICNQDVEIEFLLKNRISFVAECHYEHESFIYDGKSDKLIIAQNYGKQAEMAGNTKIDFMPGAKSVPVKRTTGKEHLKYLSKWI
jgi:hypothetical protein